MGEVREGRVGWVGENSEGVGKRGAEGEDEGVRGKLRE